MDLDSNLPKTFVNPKASDLKGLHPRWVRGDAAPYKAVKVKLK